MTIFIRNFGNNICNPSDANKIFSRLKEALILEDEIIIDFTGVISFSPQCSKRIFREIYIILGADAFYERIFLRNITEKLYRTVKKSLISI